jgi:hypothetical protein
LVFQKSKRKIWDGGIVHCSDCGYENPAEHRFCGMCGRTLPQPVPVASRAADSEEPAEQFAPDILDRHALASERLRPTPEGSATSISGPSFLGLSDQPSAPEFSYLLEDEPRTGAGRVLLALVIIAAMGAVGWWEVREHGGMPWLASMLRKPKQLMGKAEEGVPADRLNRSHAALMQSTKNPNASQEAELQLQDHDLVPKASESLEVKKPAAANSQSTANSPSSESQSPSNRVNAEDAVRNQSAGEKEKQATAANSEAADGTEAAVRKSSSGDKDAQAMKAPPRSGAEQAAPSESADLKPSVKPAAGKAVSDTREAAANESTRTTRRSSSETDSTTLIAEKYLYGHGVPQDCNRALTLLRPAADSNPKARSLLGAMYATGHCVPRDLPSSYHWFALALREEPNNVWVSRNLQSVWNQMSNSEKQLAMRMTK